jgi:hypothetical protein
MTTRIAIRWSGLDHQEHAYPADDITGDWLFAEPMCAPWQHAIPHPRRSVSSADRPALGSDRCLSCSVWTRQNDHEIVVDGTPIAGRRRGDLSEQAVS